MGIDITPYLAGVGISDLIPEKWVHTRNTTTIVFLYRNEILVSFLVPHSLLWLGFFTYDALNKAKIGIHFPTQTIYL